LLDLRTPIATSSLVLGETYTLLRVTHGFEAAWRFADRLRLGGLVRVIALETGVEDDAYAILEKYRDHDFSFVDATSFAICRREDIAHAFAFDRHFATAGLARLGVDVPSPKP